MSAVEQLAQAILDGRVRLIADAQHVDGRSMTYYDVVVDPPTPSPDAPTGD